MVKRFVLFLFVLLLAVPAHGAAISKAKSVKEQMKSARSLLKQMKGMKGEERAEQRRKAIAAYEKVIEYFPKEKREVAQAYFEIGELYRYLKEKEAAEKHFLKVLDYPEEKGPLAEALLSLARFRFKEKAYKEAIERLSHLLKACGEEKADCGKGLLLWGKCLWELGDLKEMRKVLERIIKEYSKSTVRVADAYDLISQSYIRAGDLEKAREAIEACRDALLKDVSEDKERTARIRRIEKMKAIGLLEKAKKEKEANLLEK